MTRRHGEATEAFPRRYARTQRFSLGAPRSLTVSPDGERVVFLRSAAADDPSTGLWCLDASGEERLVVDPSTLGADEAALTAEERVRRERVRESATGVVSYAADRDVRRVCLAVAGELYVADLDGDVRRVPVAQRVADPRLSPDGQRIAFAAEGGLYIVNVDAVVASRVTGEADAEGPDVTWGLPEFVAAEEMGRARGFWWSPDGQALAVTRVDVGPVQRWHLADPVDPSVRPSEVAYPAAGTPNADVRLVVIDLSEAAPVEVDWDRGYFPYLAQVRWEPDEPLTAVVQSRDQRTLRVLAVDRGTGATRTVHEEHDLHWVDLVPGTPRWLPDGRLVVAAQVEDTHGLAVDGRVLTPPGLQIHALLGVDGESLLVDASRDPVEAGVWRIPVGSAPDGAPDGPRDGEEPELLSEPGGVASGAVGGGTLVVAQRTLDAEGVETVVRRDSGDTVLRSLAQPSGLSVRVELMSLTDAELRAALVLPSWWGEGDDPLPVLLDPYGGPGHARVVAARDAYLVSQWFAEHGFAVLVIDGRGTPGRGPAWERAVAGDLAEPPLTDQIEALQAAGAARPGLDLGRVGIRGWSFGGYLAALAVLRRPDVVHAAVAGAPVTDMRLYDTHYTERFLGTPEEQPEAYARSSLLDEAPGLERPLLLIHGLADDNVVAAHTLRLSRALLEAGRRHTVLPLSGVTHMTPQERVAENLLLLQLDFLRDALAVR